MRCPTLFVRILFLALLLVLIPAYAADIDPLDPSEGDFLDEDPSQYEVLAFEAYLEENYLQAARHYLVYLRLRPDNETAIYNLACCYGLLSESELAALYLLRSVRAGFTDINHIMRDPDFDPVRNSEAFTAAVDEIAGMISMLRNDLGEQFFFDAPAIRQCRIRFPEDFDPSLEYPLVIGLHGLGDGPDGFIRLWDKFEEHDFIFACPQALYPLPVSKELGFSWFLWDPATEPGFHSNVIAVQNVISLLDNLEKDFLVSRVFLFGFSQGCTMTWNAGLLHPDRFDGLIGFSGWLDTGFLTTEILENSTGCNIFVAHGVNDTVVPFEAGEETITILSGMGCNVALRAFEGGHTLDRPTLLEAEEWMRSLR